MREQDEMRESFRREQESSAGQQHQSPEIFQNPFASNEPLIRDYSSEEIRRPGSNSSSRINPRTADAILRHDLSINHQENVNPFADPSLLLQSETLSPTSPRSSVHLDDSFRDVFADADDRSVTVGNDDELDWTEAEIGSMGSIDSDESWGSN